ncbi:MAG TPA: hypothetical protein VGG85_13535 [Terracidiphilus sp.]|jgi:hypothetical protein
MATLVFFFAWSACVTAGAQKVSIGIAPVFDAGGEEFGPVVVQHLTLFAYQDLLESPAAHPALLSPGGVYSPLDLSWLVDYAHDRTDLDLLLVAILKPVANPGKERWIIPVDVSLLNARTGDLLTKWTTSVEINSHKTLMEYGQVILEQGSQGRYSQYKGTYKITPSRDFEKQPLGKATAHLAKSIRETLENKLPGLSMAKPPQAALVSATMAPAAPNSCPVNVHITYGYKHAASHTFLLLVNGLDQSLNLKDGTASFSAPEGEMLLQFSVNDAPYKLQKEPMYQLSTQHDCAQKTLTLDLGASGDAHPHWE